VATLALALGGSRGCAGDEAGHESTLVGGPCEHDPDCDDRCVEGGDFPGGTCTVDCAHDEDCPAGTRCVDRAGGVCLLACEHDPDCRGSYDCKHVDREGHPGEIAVCIH
jgi:hypothetical protein